VGKRGASVPPQGLLLLRTIVFQGLRRRLLLQGFRGVGRPRPGQRDRGRSQGDEALDAAARQGRKEQHGGGAAASWRHAFPRAHLVAVPRGWGGRSGGGEGGGVGKELNARPSAGLVHLEGRKRGRQEVFEQVNAMRQGRGHGRPEQLKLQQQSFAVGVCAAPCTTTSVVRLCFPRRMPYTN